MADKYYNSEIKERYLSTQKSTVASNCDTVFKAIKPIEEMLHKDVYEFNRGDIDTLYSYLNRNSINALMVINNTIRRYMRWAVSHRICNDYDHYIDGIKQGNISRFCNQVIKRNSIIDRGTIIEWTQRLRTEFDYYNPRNSFLILAPFEGINGLLMNDVINITWHDFSKKDGRYFAFVRNRTIEVSKELYEIAKESRVTNRYCGGYSKYQTLKWFDIEDGDNIVRPIITKNNSGQFTYGGIRRQVKAVLTMLDVDYLSLKDIDISGKVYLAKTKAQEHEMAMINYLWSPYFIEEVCKQFDMDVRDKTCIQNHVRMFKKALDM